MTTIYFRRNGSTSYEQLRSVNNCAKNPAAEQNAHHVADSVTKKRLGANQADAFFNRQIPRGISGLLVSGQGSGHRHQPTGLTPNKASQPRMTR